MASTSSLASVPFILLLAAAVLPGRAAASPASEILRYEVVVMNLEAGEAGLESAPRGGGSRLSAWARSWPAFQFYQVDARVDSLVDSALAPSRMTVRVDQGGESNRESVTYGRGETARDYLSCLYLLRKGGFRQGKPVRFSVKDSQGVRQVTATPVLREKVTVPAGVFPSDRVQVRVTGEGAEPYTFTVWLTEDALRIPVRVACDLPVGESSLLLTGRSSAPP